VLADCLSVFLGRIPLVRGKIVARINTMIFHHQAVPSNLGNDGGCSDAVAVGVAFFKRPLGKIKRDRMYAVDEKKVRYWIKTHNRRLHGPERGLQDVMLFDFPRAYNAHPPTVGTGDNNMIELFSLKVREKLGITDSGYLVARPQNNCSRYHRTGQGTSTRFIYPRHPSISLELLSDYLVSGCLVARVHSRAAIFFP
jgi:hypothetical protein